MAIGQKVGTKKDGISFLDLMNNMEKMRYYADLYTSEIFRLWVYQGHHVSPWLAHTFGFICHVDAAWDLGMVREVLPLEIILSKTFFGIIRRMKFPNSRNRFLRETTTYGQILNSTLCGCSRYNAINRSLSGRILKGTFPALFRFSCNHKITRMTKSRTSMFQALGTFTVSMDFISLIVMLGCRIC